MDSSDLSPLSGCGAAKTANCLDLVFCSGEDGWVDSTAQCHSPGDAWQHSTAHEEGASVTRDGNVWLSQIQCPRVVRNRGLDAYIHRSADEGPRRRNYRERQNRRQSSTTEWHLGSWPLKIRFIRLAMRKLLMFLNCRDTYHHPCPHLKNSTTSVEETMDAAHDLPVMPRW